MLYSFLPESVVLGPSAFKKLAGDRGKEGWKRLSLSASSTVECDSGIYSGMGVADIFYLVDVNQNHDDPVKSLEVAKDARTVGQQAASTVYSFLQELNARRSQNTEFTGRFPFDYRSMAYVCGAVAGMCSAKVKPDLGKKGALVEMMAPSSVISVTGSPIITSFLYKDNDEFTTLLHIFKLCGTECVMIPGETAPSKGRKLTGGDLGTYCLRLYANVLSVAQQCGVASDHGEAFFCGLISALRPNCHNDEGGILRLALRKKTYPPATGMLTYSASEIADLSTSESIGKSDLTRYVVGELLEGTGRIARADKSLVEGLPTYFFKGEDEPAKPSSFSGFEQGFYRVMREWRKMYAEEKGLAESITIDEVSSRKFFFDDNEDRHLGSNCIAPFFMIEPSGVSTTLSSGIFMPGCQGHRVEMSMMKNAKSFASGGYMETKHRVAAGSAAYFLFENGFRARENGLSYFMSNRYRKENGLSQLNFVKSEKLGVFCKETFGSVHESDQMDNRRWITPHNPCPNPAEMVTDARTLLRFDYLGLGHELKHADLCSAKVTVTVGPLRTVSNRDLGTIEAGHGFSKRMTKTLEKTNRGHKVLASSLLSEIIIPEGFVPSGGVTGKEGDDLGDESVHDGIKLDTEDDDFDEDGKDGGGGALEDRKAPVYLDPEPPEKDEEEVPTEFGGSGGPQVRPKISTATKDSSRATT